MDNDKVRQRELNALKSAMDELKLKNSLILTFDSEEQIKIGNEEPCGRDRRVSSVSDRNSLLFILVPIHPCLKRQGINGTFR